jgi:hypothetical protein
MNNYIGIDISINSTAIYILSNRGESILSFTNKKNNNIYIKELENCGVSIFYQNRGQSDEYSESEILKIKHYLKLSEEVFSEIIKKIDLNEKTYCQIEGYSFSKNTSSILDIVSLSTLIRSKIVDGIENLEIFIISPNSLKLESCKLVYKPIDIGKKKTKLKYVNNQGIPGGSFKKPHMFRSMLEGKFKTKISEMLNDYSHLMERDKIPNPIEDIIDSIFTCLILKNSIENGTK